MIQPLVLKSSKFTPKNLQLQKSISWNHSHAWNISPHSLGFIVHTTHKKSQRLFNADAYNVLQIQRSSISCRNLLASKTLKGPEKGTMNSSSSLPCLKIPSSLTTVAEAIQRWARNEQGASDTQVKLLLACMNKNFLASRPRLRNSRALQESHATRTIDSYTIGMQLRSLIGVPLDAVKEVGRGLARKCMTTSDMMSSPIYPLP